MARGTIDIERRHSVIAARIYNPSCARPSFSLDKLVRKANYLVIYDEELNPDFPFHYYSLRVDNTKIGKYIPIVSSPEVFLPGIVMLSRARFFKVYIQDLQRGKIPTSAMIEDAEAYINQVNGEEPDAESESDGSGSGENASGTGDQAAAAVIEGADLPDDQQEAILRYLQDSEAFRGF